MPKFFLLFLLFFSSCIKAPVAGGGQVIPDEELDIISHVRAGKEYAQAGRMDMAEVEFRKALVLKPDYAVAYNDLGYSLQMQKRTSEALAAYRKALELNPSDLLARNNYARTLYADGQLELAAKSYLELVALYEEQEKPPTEFSLVELYRNIATAYFVLGNVSDALCYSELSRKLFPTQEVTAPHIRLLLVENRARQAVQILKGALSVHGDNLMSKLLLDYGIGLYAMGDTETSYQAFSRVMSKEKADFYDKQLARVVNFGISKARGDKTEEELLKNSILEADKNFCSNFKLDLENYWPYPLLENVETVISELCLS